MNIRKAILAGSWYPASASACEEEIKSFLNEISVRKDAGSHFLGGIVPHAGWYFSGSIACNVIHALKEGAPPDVVVVFGMHLHPNSPNYIMTDGAWETPFGKIEIESALAGDLAARFPFSIETDRRYSQDNTIEVQLPFIKYFFKNAKLVPIGVPPVAKSLEIGKAVVDMAKVLGLNIRIIGSTDLTHYGANYGFSPKGGDVKALDWVTRENDAGVIRAMKAMDPEEVIRQARENQNACCAGAAAAAIAAMKQLGADKSEIVRYATSYDKSPGESFVGYVGMVFGQ